MAHRTAVQVHFPRPSTRSAFPFVPNQSYFFKKETAVRILACFRLLLFWFFCFLASLLVLFILFLFLPSASLTRRESLGEYVEKGCNALRVLSIAKLPLLPALIYVPHRTSLSLLHNPSSTIKQKEFSEMVFLFLSQLTRTEFRKLVNSSDEAVSRTSSTCVHPGQNETIFR